MEFVTNEKLTIVGAAGMIGSNMAQTAIMMGLTPNICLYDPYAPGLEACGRRTIPLRFRRHEHHIHFRYQGSFDRC